MVGLHYGDSCTTICMVPDFKGVKVLDVANQAGSWRLLGADTG